MSRVETTEIEDIPHELMAEPIDWFLAEHYRHRQFCQVLNQVAGSTTFDAARIASLIDYLRNDMPLHVIEEEEDLFPILRERALPEDELEQALELLQAEHSAVANARTVLELLMEHLERKTAPGADPEASRILQEFASRELRHLALENAVILPIAKLRLSQADLRLMANRLAARRGVTLKRARA